MISQSAYYAIPRHDGPSPGVSLAERIASRSVLTVHASATDGELAAKMTDVFGRDVTAKEVAAMKAARLK